MNKATREAAAQDLAMICSVRTTVRQSKSSHWPASVGNKGNERYREKWQRHFVPLVSHFPGCVGLRRENAGMEWHTLLERIPSYACTVS